MTPRRPTTRSSPAILLWSEPTLLANGWRRSIGQYPNPRPMPLLATRRKKPVVAKLGWWDAYGGTSAGIRTRRWHPGSEIQLWLTQSPLVPPKLPRKPPALSLSLRHKQEAITASL